MKDGESLKYENHFKQIRLLQESTKYFAEIFKEKYKQKFKSKWKDNKQSANEFKKSAQKIKSNLKGNELVNFDKGNTSDWDITLLGKVLTSNLFKDSNSKWIKDIIEIRNKTAHSPDITISDEKYEDFYAKYFKAMISLGYSAEKLKKLKIDISKGNNSKFSDIEQAKKMANEEINNKNYSKAIEIYSNLLKSFDNLSSGQKADLFYERSVVNLLNYKNVNSDEKYLHRSLLDAKHSNRLVPRRSKTYSLIGEIYHKLDELEESENYYEIGLALDVSNEKMKNSLAFIKCKSDQQKCHKQINPIFLQMDKETAISNLNEPLLTKESNLNSQKFGRKSFINDCRRKALVLDHRKYYFDVKSTLSMKKVISITHTPPKKQKISASIANLKALFLKDIDFSHDHIMDGYVLTMINIDVPVYQPPPLSTLFLAQDEHGMVERVAMYNLGLSENSILETYKIGRKFSIINPYIRMANDMKPMIRIDDPRTIILSDEQMTKLNICTK
jgi:tetratricopeptide (TPR) repeat protein